METTKEEREAWLRVEGVEPQASEGAFGRLIRDVDTLEEALRAMLDESDPAWEEWTEDDDRLLADTATGKARAVLAPKP